MRFPREQAWAIALELRVMKRNWNGFSKWLQVFAVVIPLGMSACGKQTFDKQQFGASVSANQYITIKPKVDIVMFQDISPSMVQAMGVLQPQLNSFINSINSNWDFHFAVLPLQQKDDLRNRYIIASNCIGVQNCLTPSQSSYFSNGYGWYTANATLGSGSQDIGFGNMQANLSDSNSMTGSGFLRPDAMLVVIPFTNGNDFTGMVAGTSGTAPCTGDTIVNPQGGNLCITNYNSANAINSYNNFKNYLMTQVKPSVSLVSFYSVAAGTTAQSPDTSIGGCAGATAWPGTRYIQMSLDIDQAFSGYINGGSYNICSNALNSVLGSISTRMQNIILAIQFNYIVLQDRPVPSSLHVYKNGQEIPANNATNGWTLYNVVGGNQQVTTNQPTSYSPYPGNYQTGYFIQLNGSARFSGSDQITYTYEKF